MERKVGLASYFIRCDNCGTGLCQMARFFASLGASAKDGIVISHTRAEIELRDIAPKISLLRPRTPDNGNLVGKNLREFSIICSGLPGTKKRGKITVRETEV